MNNYIKNFIGCELLWPTPISYFKFTDWIFYKKDLLNAVRNLESEQRNNLESGVSPQLKVNGIKESDFDLFVKNKEKYPVLNKIESFFKDCIYENLYSVLPSHQKEYNTILDNVDIAITDAWYHITNDQGAHHFHCHPASSWSGIFYVQTKGTNIETSNGVNRFFNTVSNTGNSDLGSQWWHNCNIFVNPMMAEGTLILFPSWIWHDATAYEGDDDRIVIAFNSVINQK